MMFYHVFLLNLSQKANIYIFSLLNSNGEKMDKNKLYLVLMALIYSIALGSLIYIWPDFKALWVFLQIITLPAIYYIGFEILMERQKKEFENSIDLVSEEFNFLQCKINELEQQNKALKIKGKRFK